MKKLEKLTLKEMGDSAIALCPTEEQRSIVAGSGYWITGSNGENYWVEGEEIYVHPGIGHYGTVTDFMNSQQTAWYDEIAAALLPGACSYAADQINQMRWASATELDLMGYNSTDQIYWTMVDLGNGNGFDYNYYDGNTGCLLFTKHINSLGYFVN